VAGKNFGKFYLFLRKAVEKPAHCERPYQVMLGQLKASPGVIVIIIIIIIIIDIAQMMSFAVRSASSTYFVL